MTPSIPRLAREAIELAHQVNAREHTISEAFVREPKPIEVLARYVEDTAAIVEAAIHLDRARLVMETANGDDMMDAIAVAAVRQVALDDVVRAYRAKGAT